VPVRWVIVGAGAIGGGLGGALAKAGEQVVLGARGHRLRALRDGGLRWQTPRHDLRLEVPVVASEGLVPQPGDVLCVATKLFDVAGALQGLPEAWRSHPVICLCNGVDAPRLAVRAGFGTVLTTAVYVPASAQWPDIARLWGVDGYGAVHVGVVRGDGARVRDAFAEALQRAGFDGVAHDDVQPYVHAKWCTNLMGAAMAVVVPEEWERVAMAALQEGRAVLEAAGLPLVATEALTVRPLALGRIDGEERGGGSTWRSLREGKPLETPQITGALLRLAERSGLDAPVNAALAGAARRAARERWGGPQLRADDLGVWI
jgi:2-dehydropantoate 2-reductase